MNQRYQNDLWTLDDELEISGTGDLVARMALEVAPPFSVRVTGKWGSGKTSVLRRAFVTLKGNPVQQAVPLDQDIKEPGSEAWERWNYDAEERQLLLKWPGDLCNIADRSLCVWYSPWQHQGAQNPLVPLLLEIQAHFTTWVQVKEGAKKLNRRGGLAALTLLERVIDAAVSLKLQRGMKLFQGTTDAVRKSWKEAEPDLTRLSDGQRFHLLFEDAVENVLLSLSNQKEKASLGRERLIIFIDDLDRCEESVIIDLLEAIKLYLGSPRCVFLLGMDDTAVLGAMRRHWVQRSDDDNREYLEKMFQATVSVPLPRPLNIRKSISDQLAHHRFPECSDCAEMIERLLEPNPRKIKNFCNSLCAAWNQFVGEVSASSEHAQRFILFHYLRLFHRSVWRILERQPQALPLLHRVLINSREPIPPIVGFDEDDQRVLRELFERAFSHVLRDVGTRNPDDEFKYHRNMDLDQAVKLFEERLDSKRSDEFFISRFKELVGPDESLGDDFLYLPKQRSRRRNEILFRRFDDGE